ncbi:HDOD domain-containing protein [Permianibacter sp. IMCC34836]|uniref:HDOD domain-containing protein n=1 Tax=Permianibacter fluminis TaxID=2738515 RepID=UPI001558190A|nr:HDOD domain-containing protein [Permianibacter fluminis]NQD38195.1 HDOD domain-containing protein [Permianibacter fluminis]
MELPSRLQQWLDNANAQFELLPHEPGRSFAELAGSLKIPIEAVIRAVPLADSQGRLIALVPANYLLDFEALQALTMRELDVLSMAESQTHFTGCAPNCRPALANVFGWKVVCDEAIFSHDRLYCESGSGDSLLGFSRAEFRRLLGEVGCGHIGLPPDALKGAVSEMAQEEVVTHFMPLRLKQRVQETFDLPAMPDMANDIMKLRVDPHASARDLANIVNRDPSLAAQIMSWANSPYYGFSGRIPSLEMAIMRVLGFEMVLNLALGIVVGRSLKVPREGPLGLKAFWTHSILCAVLAERLCQRMPAKFRPPRGMVYLSGLLHNFGHLLLGHVFPPQFFLVNRYVAANPAVQVDVIERHVLGVSHEEIGAWLMQAWHMPEELITAVRWHHQEEFSSPYAVYSNLVLIANRLLKRLNIGDAGSSHLPAAVMASLHLTGDEVEGEFEQLRDKRAELEALAQKLAA